MEKGAMEDMCPVDVPKAVDAAHTGFWRAIKVPLGTDKEVPILASLSELGSTYYAGLSVRTF